MGMEIWLISSFTCQTGYQCQNFTGKLFLIQFKMLEWQLLVSTTFISRVYQVTTFCVLPFLIILSWTTSTIQKIFHGVSCGLAGLRTWLLQFLMFLIYLKWTF